MTRGERAVGAAALVLTVVAAGISLSLPPLGLPVDARLRAGSPVPLAAVDGRIAALVPAALAGLVLLVGRPRDPWHRRLTADLAAAPIAVFLVAQLNGLRDLPALVLVYAAAAAAVLMRSVPGRWPFSIAAMLGIVPWGVVAFSQVGALIAGDPPSIAVRVLTASVLVLAVAEFLRRPGVAAPVLVVLPPIVLAVGSLAV